MTRHVQLNNIDHRHLRIDTRRSAALGDDVAFAATFPAEFRDLQAYYPIVFRTDRAGALAPVALLGFQEGCNLFLNGESLESARWDAAYLPLAIERQPFLIGRALSEHEREELTIHLDLDSPRVGTQTGEPLFREHGGATEYLERITSVLLTLHNGFASVPAFVDALQQHGLLESFVLDVELDDGSAHRLAGYFTINEERLRALDAAALGELHSAGHLEPVFMAVAALSNFRDLIGRMNLRRAAGR